MSELTELHKLLIEDYKRLLETEEMTPADRKALREFLRDNDITCVGENNKDMRKLHDASILPFPEDGDTMINQ